MAKPYLYTQEMIDRYSRMEDCGKMTISDFWKRNAIEYPQKEALVDSRNRLTWSQANKLIDRLAVSLIELGLKRDDVVVLQLPNCAELLLMRMACERAGLLQLPVLRTLRHTEMQHILKYTGARVVVIPWKYREFDHFEMIQELKSGLPELKHVIVWGEEVPGKTISIRKLLSNPVEDKYPPDYLEGKKIPPLNLSTINLTTGTTGLPKFVEWPTCCFVITGLLVERLNLTGEDICGSFTGAVLGPNVVAFYVGVQVAAKIVFLEHWTVEEGLRLIQEEKITIPCIVPTQLAEILSHPDLKKYDLSSIRVVRSAGALLPHLLASEAEEKLNCRVQNGYGTADFGPVSENDINNPPEVRRLTVGTPLAGTEIQLRDASGKVVQKGEVGEIFARGECTASGYYKDPETTAQMWTKDGWYRTGDLGKLDESGNLMIVGREKDMIIRGGQNIYPIEIVNLLLSHPEVADAGIVAIPDSKMGERACACIVPRPGQQISFEEIVAFLKSKRIAAYKMPEKFLLMEKLPYVGGMKLDRKALQAEAVKTLKNRGEIQ